LKVFFTIYLFSINAIICKKPKHLAYINRTIILPIYTASELVKWNINAGGFVKEVASMDLEEAKLCPICARQG
jgi:hypothetical protein